MTPLWHQLTTENTGVCYSSSSILLTYNESGKTNESLVRLTSHASYMHSRLCHRNLQKFCKTMWNIQRIIAYNAKLCISKDSHHKDEIVMTPSYIYTGNLYIGKTISLYIKMAPRTQEPNDHWGTPRAKPYCKIYVIYVLIYITISSV